MISEKSKVQVLDKKQLEKVIGGAETFTTAHEAEHVKQQTTK